MNNDNEDTSRSLYATPSITEIQINNFVLGQDDGGSNQDVNMEEELVD